MMRWNGYRRNITILVAVMGIVNMTDARLVKAADKDVVSYALSDIKYDNDGGVTTLHQNHKDELTIKMDTNDLAEGYYTTFLSTPTKQEVKEGEVIAVSLRTNKELKMNFNLLDQNGKAFSCTDGEEVYLKQEDSTIYQLASVKYGCFTVPSGFRGRILIPVSQVVSKEEAKGIRQLAFVLTQKEKEETEVVLTGFEVLKSTHGINAEIKECYHVVGEQNIQVPPAGEYQYEYQLIKKNQEVSKTRYQITLQKEVPGISISEEGMLTVTKDALEEVIPLLFTMEDGQQFLYKITATESWLKGQRAIPSEEEAIGYWNIEEYAHLFRWIEEALRILLVAGIVAYLIFYQKRVKEN